MNIRLQLHDGGFAEINLPQHPGPYILWHGRLFVMSRDNDALFLERSHVVIQDAGSEKT